MECNKEEAIRAKQVAEKKMENKDFVGARKFATRAQQLYVDLKDIPQMILVCDVHCAAENKIYGSENDWYGILQVGQTVDETTIKKQYRKLALLLHPDKNQFAGASDAFKLIGEAQKVLVDHERRMVYDSKCKAAGRSQVPNMATQRSRQSSARGAHPWFQNSVVGDAASKSMHQQSQQVKDQTQPAPAPAPAPAPDTNRNRPTFWTICPFCAVKYEYYKEQVNKPLICQSCKRRFIAYEANGPTIYPATSSSRPKVPPKKEAVRKGQPSAVPKSTSNKRSSKPTNVGNTNFGNVKRDCSLGTAFTSEADKKPMRHDSIRNTNFKTVDNRKNKYDSSGSSDSCETESSTDTEEDSVVELDDDNPLGKNSGHHTAQNLRRSSRSRQQVSYDDYLSDDELGKPSKKFKSAEDVDLDADSLAQDDGVGTPNSFTGNYVPDPDFNSFDPLRSLDKFKVGQIWAMYCDEDSLPKYYGLIKKIDSPPNFGLHMAWLFSLKSKDQIQWVDKSMPVTCGKFEVGKKKSQKFDDAGAFSHQIIALDSKAKDVYDILPQTGDVWALYKGWDKNMTPSDLLLCEYEIVEVLENKKSSTSVLLLEQVKDYNSVFKPQSGGELELTDEIPSGEMLRFSHQIPAIRLTDEKDGSLRGLWELDPASLPVYFFL